LFGHDLDVECFLFHSSSFVWSVVGNQRSAMITFIPDRLSGQYCLVIFGVEPMSRPSLSTTRK
jgi:hypothetical protein